MINCVLYFDIKELIGEKAVRPLIFKKPYKLHTKNIIYVVNRRIIKMENNKKVMSTDVKRLCGMAIFVALAVVATILPN